MYIVAVKIADSPIAGKGVFAEQAIEKGETCWIYKQGYDIELSTEEYKAIPEETKSRIAKTGYLSPWTDKYIFPPEDDPAQYTNHSANNNLSVIYDESASPEPYFIANRDIAIGEELTNNYHEFDKVTQETMPNWAK